MAIRRDHSPDDDDEGRGDATASRRRGDCVVDAQRPTRARSPSPASAATSVRVMSWFPCCLRTRHTEGSNMPPGGSRTTGLLARGPLLQAHDCDEQCYLHHSLNVPNICALVFGQIHQMALAGNWTLVPLLLDAIGLSQSAGYRAFARVITYRRRGLRRVANWGIR